MKKSGPPFRLNYHQETFPPIRPKLPVSTSSPVPGTSAASPMLTSPLAVPNVNLKSTPTETTVSTCSSTGTMVNTAVTSRAEGSNSHVPVMIVNPLQYQKPRTETVSSASVVTTFTSSNNVSSSASTPVSVEQNSNLPGDISVSGHIAVPMQQGFIQAGGNILQSTVFPNSVVLGSPFIHSDRLTGSNFVFGSSPQQFLFQGNLVQGNYLQTSTGNFVQNNLLQGNVMPSNLVSGGLVQGNLLQGSMVPENLVQGNFNQAFSIPSGFMQMNPFTVSTSGTPVIVTSALQPNTVSTSASAAISSSKERSGTTIKPTPSTPRLQNFQFVIEPDPEFDEKMKKAKLVQLQSNIENNRVVIDRSSASLSLQPGASRVVSDWSSHSRPEGITEEEGFIPKITDCYSMKKFSLTQMMNLLNEKADMLSLFKKGTRNYFRAEVFCKVAKKFNVTGLSSVIVDEFYDNLISPYITVGEVLLLKKHVSALKKTSKIELESSSVPKVKDKSSVFNSKRKTEDMSSNPNKNDTNDKSFAGQMLQWKTESINTLNPDLLRYFSDESNEAHERRTNDENRVSSKAFSCSEGIEIDLTEEETTVKGQVKKNIEIFHKNENEISASCASDKNDRSIVGLNESEPEKIRRAFNMKVNVDNMRKVNADHICHKSTERTLEIDEAEMIRKAFTLPRLVNEQKKSEMFQPNEEIIGLSERRPQTNKVQKLAISKSSLQQVDVPKKTGNLEDLTTQLWRRKVEQQEKLIQEMHMVWNMKTTKGQVDQVRCGKPDIHDDKKEGINTQSKGSDAEGILHIDSDDEIGNQVELKLSCTQKERAEDKQDDTRTNNERESCNKSDELKTTDTEDIKAKITETGSVTDEEELEIGEDDGELVLDLTAESGSDGESVVLEEEEENIKKMSECEVSQTKLLSRRWKLSNILANCEPKRQKPVNAAEPVATVEAVDRFMSDSEKDSSVILKVCYLCGLKFLNMNQMWYHLVDKHAKVQPTSSLGHNFLCSHCYRSFSSIIEVRKHELETHLSDYPCFFCGLSLHNRWGMIKHIAAMHSELYQCHICDGQFLGEKNFRIHMWTAHDSSRSQEEKRAMYVCLFCNVKHAYKRNLRVHLHNAHMQMPFVYSKEYLCVSCRHTFLDKDALFFHRSENACFAEKIHQLNPASLSSLVNEVVSLKQSQTDKDKQTVLNRKKHMKRSKESVEKNKGVVTMMLAEEVERKRRFRSLFENADSEPGRITREVVVNGKKSMYSYLEFVTKLNMDGHIEAEDLPIVVDTLVKFILQQFPNMNLDGNSNNLYDLAVSLSRTPIYTSVLELFGYGPLPLDHTLKQNVGAFLCKLDNHLHFKKSLCNGENIPEALNVMIWCLKTTLEAWKQSEKCSNQPLGAVTAKFQTMCPSENSQLVVVETFMDKTKAKLKNLIEIHKSDVRFLSALANNEFTSRLCEYMEVTCKVLSNSTIGITISEHGIQGNKCLILSNPCTILPAVIPAVPDSSNAGLAQQLPVFPSCVLPIPISAVQAMPLTISSPVTTHQQAQVCPRKLNTQGEAERPSEAEICTTSSDTSKKEVENQAGLEKNKNDKRKVGLMDGQHIEGTKKIKDMPKSKNLMPKSSVQTEVTATSFGVAAVQNPLVMQMPQLAAKKPAMSVPTCVALHQQQTVTPTSLLLLTRSVAATQVVSASVGASSRNKPLILPNNITQIPSPIMSAQVRLVPIGLATPQQPQLMPRTMVQIPRFAPQTLIISTSGAFSVTEGPQFLTSNVMQMTSSTSQTLVTTTSSFVSAGQQQHNVVTNSSINAPDLASLMTGAPLQSIQPQPQPDFILVQDFQNTDNEQNSDQNQNMELNRKIAVNNQLKSMLQLKKTLSSMKGMQIAQKYRTQTFRSELKERRRRNGSCRKIKPEESKACDKNLRQRKPSVKYTLDDYIWDESEEEEIILSPEESCESDDEWKPHNWKSDSDGDASENIEAVDSSDTSDLDEIGEYLARDTQPGEITKCSEGDAEVNQTMVSMDNEKTATEKSAGPEIKTSTVETEVNQTVVKMDDEKAIAEKSEVVNTDENTIENDTTVIKIDGGMDETYVKRSEVVIEKMRTFLKNKDENTIENDTTVRSEVVIEKMRIFLKNKVKTNETNSEKSESFEEKHVTIDLTTPEHSVDMCKETEVATDELITENSVDKDPMFKESKMTTDGIRAEKSKDIILKDNSFMKHLEETVEREIKDSNVKSRWALKQYLDESMVTYKSESLKRVVSDDSIDDKPRKVVKIEKSPSCLKSCSKTAPWWDSYVKCCYVKLERNVQIEKLAIGGILRNTNTKDYTDRKMTRHFVKQICTNNFNTEMVKVVAKNETQLQSKGIENANEITSKCEISSPKKRGRRKRLYKEIECNDSEECCDISVNEIVQETNKPTMLQTDKVTKAENENLKMIHIKQKEKLNSIKAECTKTGPDDMKSHQGRGRPRKIGKETHEIVRDSVETVKQGLDGKALESNQEKDADNKSESKYIKNKGHYINNKGSYNTNTKKTLETNLNEITKNCNQSCNTMPRKRGRPKKNKPIADDRPERSLSNKSKLEEIRSDRKNKKYELVNKSADDQNKANTDESSSGRKFLRPRKKCNYMEEYCSESSVTEDEDSATDSEWDTTAKKRRENTGSSNKRIMSKIEDEEEENVQEDLDIIKSNKMDDNEKQKLEVTSICEQTPQDPAINLSVNSVGGNAHKEQYNYKQNEAKECTEPLLYVRQIDRAESFVVKSENDMEGMFEETGRMPSKMADVIKYSSNITVTNSVTNNVQGLNESNIRVKTEPVDLEFSNLEYGEISSDDQLCQKAVVNQHTMSLAGAYFDQSKTNYIRRGHLPPVKQELAHQTWEVPFSVTNSSSPVPVTLFSGNFSLPVRYSTISVGHCVVATLTSSTSSALVTQAASHMGTFVSSSIPVNKSNNNICTIADNKWKTIDDGQVQDKSTRKPNILSRYGQIPTVIGPTAKITRHPLMLIPSDSISPKSSGTNSSPKLIGSVPSKLVSVLNSTTGTLTASAKLFGSVVPDTTTTNSTTSTLSSANNSAANSPSAVKSSQVSSVGQSKPVAPYTVKSFRVSSGVKNKRFVNPGSVPAMRKPVSSASTTRAVWSPKNPWGAKFHSSNKPDIIPKGQKRTMPFSFNCALINIPGTNQFTLVQIPLPNSVVQQDPGTQQVQGLQQTGMVQPTQLLPTNPQPSMIQPTQLLSTNPQTSLIQPTQLLSTNPQTSMIQPTQLLASIPQSGMVQPTQLSSNLQIGMVQPTQLLATNSQLHINQQAIQAQYSSNQVTPAGQIMLPIVTPNQSFQTSKSTEQQTTNHGQQVLTAPSCIPVVIKSEPPDVDEDGDQIAQPPQSNMSSHLTEFSCSSQPLATHHTSMPGQSTALKQDLNTSHSTVINQTLQPSVVQTNQSMPQLHVPILQQTSLPFLQSSMLSISGGALPASGLQPDQVIQPNQIMQFQVGVQQSGQSPLTLIGQPQVSGIGQSISPGQCGSLIPPSGTQIPVGSLLNQQTLMVDQNTPLVPGQFIFVPNSSQAAAISPSVKPGTTKTPGEPKPPKKAVYIKPKESKVEKKAEDVGEHKAAKASKGEQEPQTSHKQTGRKHKKPPIWSARKEGKLHCIVCQAVFYNPAKLGKHLQEVHREYIMTKLAEKDTEKDGAAENKLKHVKDSQ